MVVVSRDNKVFLEKKLLHETTLRECLLEQYPPFYFEFAQNFIFIHKYEGFRPADMLAAISEKFTKNPNDSRSITISIF